MEYESLDSNIDEVSDLLRREDDVSVELIAYGFCYGDKTEDVEDLFLNFINHPNPAVRRACVLMLEYSIRSNKDVPTELMKVFYQRKAKERDKYVLGAIDDLEDVVELYV